MQSLTPTTSTVTVLEDRSWLKDLEGLQSAVGITLDGDNVRATFDAGTHLPSGAVLAKRTSDSKGTLYAGTSDEVQTVTEGGSGLTSYTLTLSGETTASIDAGAAASAVQSALEALANVGSGNVQVTGDAGGPYTVKFVGDLYNTDVAQMTSTPTGGTGTVTVATTTAGGADLGSGGTGTAVGHLHSGETVPATGDMHLAYVHRADVIEANLPIATGPGALDAAAKADLTHCAYF